MSTFGFFDSKDLKSYSRELNVDLITNNNKRRSKKESIINPILKKTYKKVYSSRRSKEE